MYGGILHCCMPSLCIHTMYRQAAAQIKKLSQELQDLVKSLEWQPVASRGFKEVHHVNVQELRAMTHEVKRLAVSQNGIGHRRVCATDSLVALGAWSKGRSSSRQFNCVRRETLARSIIGRVKLVPFWVATDVNPADHPSRGRPILPPPLPDWCLEHCAG